jgi:uncharacterized protein YerC
MTLRRRLGKWPRALLVVAITLEGWVPDCSASWSDLKHWKQALDQEWTEVENAKGAFNLDCAIVSSRDQAKVAACSERHAQLQTKIARYKKTLDFYERSREQVQALDAELGLLDKRIEMTRKELTRDGAYLRDYSLSLDEWVTLPAEARARAQHVAIEALFTLVGETFATYFQTHIYSSQNSLKNLSAWRYQQHLTAAERQSPQLKALWARLDEGIDRATRYAEITAALNAFKDGALALRNRDEGLEALLDVMGIINSQWIHNRGIALLIADGKLGIYIPYAYGAPYAAKARVEELANLAEDSLWSLKVVTNRYLKDVQRRKGLLADRDSLLRGGTTD